MAWNCQLLPIVRPSTVFREAPMKVLKFTAFELAIGIP